MQERLGRVGVDHAADSFRDGVCAGSRLAPWRRAPVVANRHLRVPGFARRAERRC
jgi:hypothetical protein